MLYVFQCVMQKYKKFTNFAGLYFLYSITFRHQTLHFFCQFKELQQYLKPIFRKPFRFTPTYYPYMQDSRHSKPTWLSLVGVGSEEKFVILFSFKSISTPIYEQKSIQVIVLKQTLNNYWMRSSRIWGIIKAQTEALIISHILREPNSIIVSLFFENILNSV